MHKSINIFVCVHWCLCYLNLYWWLQFYFHMEVSFPSWSVSPNSEKSSSPEPRCIYWVVQLQ